MKSQTRLVLISALALPGLAWLSASFWTRAHQARLAALEYEPAPPGMVLVPAGEFLMGSDDANAEPDERPRRKVFLPAFYIDRCEVTNRRYKEFKPDHVYPPGEDDLPVTLVRKHEAEAFCRWAGGRLPTNAEWEKAARGVDGRIYPWGNEFRAECANLDRRMAFSRLNEGATIFRAPSNAPACQGPLLRSTGKRPGGTYPSGASPYGCQDMSGNVWEWVSDVWRDKTFPGASGGGEVRGIIRGGAYSYSRFQARTSYQGFEDLGTTCHDVGFRCAMDAVVGNPGSVIGNR